LDSLDPGTGMGKNRGSGSESRINVPDHISESLETIFGLKILKFFDADPGSGIFLSRIRDGKNRIRDKHPGPATLLNVITDVTLTLYLLKFHEKRCCGSGFPSCLTPESGIKKIWLSNEY
jgi:hypothetical protein